MFRKLVILAAFLASPAALAGGFPGVGTVPVKAVKPGMADIEKGVHAQGVRIFTGSRKGLLKYAWFSTSNEEGDITF